MIKSKISKMSTPFYKFRKVLAYIIASLIIFLNISSVYCVEAKASILVDIGLSYDDIRQIMAENGQILPDSATRLFIQNLGVTGFVLANRQDIESWLSDKLRGYSTGGTSFGDENTSDADVLDNASKYLVNNVSKSGNTFTYNDNSRNLLNYIASSCVNDSGYKYCYSLNVLDSALSFTDGDMFSALRRLITDHNSDYFIFFYKPTNGQYRVLISNNTDIAFVQSSVNSSTTFVNCYDFESWASINIFDANTLSLNGIDKYVYNSTSKEFETVSDSVGSNREIANSRGVTFNPVVPDKGYFISLNNYKVYTVYNSLNDLKASSLGVKPYYVSSSWQNFISGSGNYTVDSSNSNNITYGDINSYVNNYYGDNGTYPDPTQVQVYIDNNIVTPDPTPTPTPNPDDSGGGGGSDDDPTFDLGFLGTIGRLIGSLITGIGNLITGILEGIVNALTGILSFLTTLITDIADVMPQGIMDLFSAILGWLPQEWITVMSLGILSMVLIGVFKIFK